MSLLKKSTKLASARKQIDIKGVEDGTLLLTRQRYRKILEVSSLNFELKSEAEQDALIETYESFLNSLGCPLQFLIRTREIDMDKYLDSLCERLSPETETIYKTQLKNYDDFIRSLIVTNKILTRHFYITIPFDGSNNKIEQKLINEQLNLNVDIVRKGLSRLGMQSRELSSLEILDLFYSFYNPHQAKLQPITLQTMNILRSSFIRKVIS